MQHFEEDPELAKIILITSCLRSQQNYDRKEAKENKINPEFTGRRSPEELASMHGEEYK